MSDTKQILIESAEVASLVWLFDGQKFRIGGQHWWWIHPLLAGGSYYLLHRSDTYNQWIAKLTRPRDLGVPGERPKAPTVTVSDRDNQPVNGPPASVGSGDGRMLVEPSSQPRQLY